MSERLSKWQSKGDPRSVAKGTDQERGSTVAAKTGVAKVEMNWKWDDQMS